MGGGWEHKENCYFHGHCPELCCHRLLPSVLSPPRAAAMGWECTRKMLLLCVTGTRRVTWGLRGCAAGPGPLLPWLSSPACLAGTVTTLALLPSLTTHRASQTPWEGASKCLGVRSGHWAGYCPSFPWPSTYSPCLADSIGEELEQIPHS